MTEDTFHTRLYNSILSLIKNTKNASNEKIIEEILTTLLQPYFLDSQKALFIELGGSFSVPIFLTFSKNSHKNFENPYFSDNYFTIFSEIKNEAINNNKDTTLILPDLIRGDRTKISLNDCIADTIDGKLEFFLKNHGLQTTHYNHIMDLFEKEKIKHFLLKEALLHQKTFILSLYRLDGKNPYTEAELTYFNELLLFLHRACVSNNYFISFLKYENGNFSNLCPDLKNEIYLQMFQSGMKYLVENGCNIKDFNPLIVGDISFNWIELKNIYAKTPDTSMPIICVIAYRDEELYDINGRCIYKVI